MDIVVSSLELGVGALIIGGDICPKDYSSLDKIAVHQAVHQRVAATTAMPGYVNAVLIDLEVERFL